MHYKTSKQSTEDNPVSWLWACMLALSPLPRATCLLIKLIHLLSQAGKKSNQTEPSATALLKHTSLGCTSHLENLEPLGLGYKWGCDVQKGGQHEGRAKKKPQAARLGRTEHDQWGIYRSIWLSWMDILRYLREIQLAGEPARWL